MNRFKGTPGPWLVNNWTSFDGEACLQVEAFEASGNRSLAIRVDGSSDPELGKANAALIAAAPDLLDCLQLLLFTRTQERGLQNTKPGESPLHDRCKAAILKAGGTVL